MSVSGCSNSSKFPKFTSTKIQFCKKVWKNNKSFWEGVKYSLKSTNSTSITSRKMHLIHQRVLFVRPILSLSVVFKEPSLDGKIDTSKKTDMSKWTEKCAHMRLLSSRIVPKCDPSDSISLPMNASIYYHSSIRIPHGHVPHPFWKRKLA